MNIVPLIGPLGAWLAALVALLAFSMNYRATLRNQRDTQFYETLKRFGDKDSPSARASAAALLSQIALSAEHTWPWRIKSRREIQWRPKLYPYLETTFNQLLVGLQLEANEVVLSSISTAIQRLHNHEIAAFDLILKNHAALQDDLANKLGRSYAARMFDYDEETLLHHDDEIYDDWVEAASATTKLSKGQIETIRRNFRPSFYKSLRDANQTYKITP